MNNGHNLRGPLDGRKCLDCGYSVAVTDASNMTMLECRRFPPQLHFMEVKSKPGLVGAQPQKQIMKRSAFPNADNACGEFHQLQNGSN